LGRVFVTDQKRQELLERRASLLKNIADIEKQRGIGALEFGPPTAPPKLVFNDRAKDKEKKPKKPKEEKFTDAFNEAQDAIEARIRDFVQSQLPESEFKALTEEMKAFEAQALASFEATRTPSERLEAALEAQKAIFKALGPVYEDTYDRATAAAVRSYVESLKSGEATFEKLSEFALEAQRNIQDALGDTLLRTMKGDFDSIGQMWLDLLLKMTAQAAATRLNEALFGNGKSSGGALTPFLQLIGNFLKPDGGSWGSEGRVMPSGVGAFDRDASVSSFGASSVGMSGAARSLSGAGSGVNIYQTINAAPGTSRADLVGAMEQSKRAAVAEVFESMRRGRVGAY
jgi:hypothetical protein